ncbi:hypothetical protein [Henriciella litoralis]|uniref:hypothetical protein n=1 Tax=Henriciella litoralis TaxID=568102 RepID=UPI000A05DF6C|nr:hypothetical protein [Henriciella litoralis]
MSDIIFYALAAVVAVALIYGLRWVASRHAEGVKSEASEKIGEALGKTPDFIHAYGATGFGLDYRANTLIVYDRKSELETFGFDKIGTWFVGMVSTEIMSPQMAHALSDPSSDTSVSARTTHTKYAIICDTNQQRICQVGIVGDRDESAVSDALKRAMPDKQTFEPIGAKAMSDLLRGQR